MNRCSAKNRSGQQCRSFALADSSFCFWHDPQRASACADARRLGGYHRRVRRTPSPQIDADLKSVDGLLVLVESLIGETLKLQNSTHRSRALAALALAQKGILEFRAAERERSFAQSIAFIQSRQPPSAQPDDHN